MHYVVEVEADPDVEKLTQLVSRDVSEVGHAFVSKKIQNNLEAKDLETRERGKHVRSRYVNLRQIASKLIGKLLLSFHSPPIIKLRSKTAIFRSGPGRGV